MKIVCINCPLGCRLLVDKYGDGTIDVKGNECPRGVKYAEQEMVDPRRVLATTVKTVSHEIPRVSVRSREAIPLHLLFTAMKEINRYTLDHDVAVGEIVLENLAATGIPLIATTSFTTGEEVDE
jgi:CxxC motif-containing protein